MLVVGFEAPEGGFHAVNGDEGAVGDFVGEGWVGGWVLGPKEDAPYRGLDAVAADD